MGGTAGGRIELGLKKRQVHGSKESVHYCVTETQTLEICINMNRTIKEQLASLFLPRITAEEIDQVTRLTDMRQQRANDCGCQRCTDLLSKLHNNGSALLDEHNLEQWGLKFWSNPVDSNMANSYNQDKVLATNVIDALKHNEKYADHLLASEQEWQESNSAKCADQDNDSYWSSHFRDVKKACGKLLGNLEQQ